MKMETKAKMKSKMNFRFCFHFVFHFRFSFSFYFLKVFAFLLIPRGLEVPGKGQLSLTWSISARAFPFANFVRVQPLP